ncbi:hypothetical protein ACIQNU_32440 [Streptomyces sp. NPDC091292]|uniref:hypothetical protein n=1 Tax=Streptomyces sp. NPDC091292 TaxID=3365991 RepID=UPI0037FFC39B
MTITADTPPTPPTRNTPVALARGFLTGGVIGASLAAFVVGTLIESVPLCVGGVGLLLAYGLIAFLASVPRRFREAGVVPCTALAVVESLEAVGSDATSDVAVRFDVTVAPDGARAYRVAFTQDINLADLPGYRRGGVVVVQYPPDRPWRVRIVKRPAPEWEERVAGARIDSARGPVLSEPSASCAVGFVTLLALLLAAAGVVLLYRADLFDEAASSTPPVTPSSSSSSTMESSASATVTLGPNQSFLDKGELRKAVGSLAKGTDARAALTVVVQERQLSVVYAPTGTQAPAFDPDSPPYDRFPTLVEEATSSLGAGSPQTWRLTVEPLSGSVTIRVDVTGAGGAAWLEADGQGTVVRRTPAH